jgi:hypothetical protein
MQGLWLKKSKTLFMAFISKNSLALLPENIPGQPTLAYPIHLLSSTINNADIVQQFLFLTTKFRPGQIQVGAIHHPDAILQLELLFNPK